MQVYSEVGYGNGTIFVTPGVHHPENKDWVVLGQSESGADVFRPVMLTVKFKDGAAEVPDALGKYLVAEGLAKFSAVQVAVAVGQAAFDKLAKIVYSKPIAVG